MLDSIERDSSTDWMGGYRCMGPAKGWGRILSLIGPARLFRWKVHSRNQWRKSCAESPNEGRSTPHVLVVHLGIPYPTRRITSGIFVK